MFNIARINNINTVDLTANSSIASSIRKEWIKKQSNIDGLIMKQLSILPIFIQVSC